MAMETAHDLKNLPFSMQLVKEEYHWQGMKDECD